MTDNSISPLAHLKLGPFAGPPAAAADNADPRLLDDRNRTLNRRRAEGRPFALSDEPEARWALGMIALWLVVFGSLVVAGSLLLLIGGGL